MKDLKAKKIQYGYFDLPMTFLSSKPLYLKLMRYLLVSCFTTLFLLVPMVTFYFLSSPLDNFPLQFFYILCFFSCLFCFFLTTFVQIQNSIEKKMAQDLLLKSLYLTKLSHTKSMSEKDPSTRILKTAQSLLFLSHHEHTNQLHSKEIYLPEFLDTLSEALDFLEQLPELETIELTKANFTNKKDVIQKIQLGIITNKEIERTLWYYFLKIIHSTEKNESIDVTEFSKKAGKERTQLLAQFVLKTLNHIIQHEKNESPLSNLTASQVDNLTKDKKSLGLDLVLNEQYLQDKIKDIYYKKSNLK